MRLSLPATQHQNTDVKDEIDNALSSSSNGKIVMEVVHNNPAKGFGSFIYI